MSTMYDIKSAVSTDILKEKLTIEDRAYLLCDICDALGWDLYNKRDYNDYFISIDIDKAINDLLKLDK